MIQVDDVQVGYGEALIIDSLMVTIPKGDRKSVV